MDAQAKEETIYERFVGWFLENYRFQITVSTIVLNVFANVFVFSILLNQDDNGYVCDGLFDWKNIESPPESFLLFVGLLIIWVGMSLLIVLMIWGTNFFRSGLGSVCIFSGFIMGLGDLFLLMAYVANGTCEDGVTLCVDKDRCFDSAPAPWKQMAPFLPFLLFFMHALWCVSCTTLEVFGTDLEKGVSEKVMKILSSDNEEEDEPKSTGVIAFKPLSVVGRVMQASGDKHEHSH